MMQWNEMRNQRWLHHFVGFILSLFFPLFALLNVLFYIPNCKYALSFVCSIAHQCVSIVAAVINKNPDYSVRLCINYNKNKALKLYSNVAEICYANNVKDSGTYSYHIRTFLLQTFQKRLPKSRTANNGGLKKIIK